MGNPFKVGNLIGYKSGLSPDPKKFPVTGIDGDEVYYMNPFYPAEESHAHYENFILMEESVVKTIPGNVVTFLLKGINPDGEREEQLASYTIEADTPDDALLKAFKLAVTDYLMCGWTMALYLVSETIHVIQNP